MKQMINPEKNNQNINYSMKIIESPILVYLKKKKHIPNIIICHSHNP